MLSKHDVSTWKSLSRHFRQLFDEYDLIVGYSTDVMLPMLEGKSYFALEHGTLRDIPFEATSQGRLTALAYHLANHVFVTNFDCLKNAQTLSGDRVTFVNHPYDDRADESDLKIAPLRRKLQESLDADHLFFFPTRHDWVAGTGYADKANDVFLRAFARLRKTFAVGMVCCNWGRNVRESKQLLEELGVSRHVHWEKPMGMVRFKRTARACGMVIDQFKLGAFGGVLFKSLAAGVPCCTWLDDEAVARRFGAPIPCINAGTEDELVRKLSDLLRHPERFDELGRQSREWIDSYHSSRETIARQLRVFVPYLDGQAVACESDGRSVAA
jgi:glycosyltransferase involved in cell wall biosynthesis